MQVVCGRDAERTAEAAARLGWAETETDWRRLVERPDVDLVDICTPGDTHAEIAIAALRRASTCCARSRWPTRSPRPRR